MSGLINAIAGGGSLILFPALLAAGLPVVRSDRLAPDPPITRTAGPCSQTEIIPPEHWEHVTVQLAATPGLMSPRSDPQRRRRLFSVLARTYPGSVLAALGRLAEDYGAEQAASIDRSTPK